MNELIRVDYSTQELTVSGRELHEFLEVKRTFRLLLKDVTATPWPLANK